MPMGRYEGGAVLHEVRFGVRSTVPFIRLRSKDAWSSTARPVVKLHGFSSGASLSNVLSGAPGWRSIGDYPLDALLATGRSVYLPITGDSFGSDYGTMTGEPGFVGLGTTAIDVMAEQAASDGITFSKIDLIGGSMGAANALSWMHANQNDWDRAAVYVPAINLMEIYDLAPIGGVVDAMEVAYGAGDRDGVESASEGNDPSRLDWTGFDLPSRLTVIAASNDGIINYATVSAWTTALGVPLITTNLNHFSIDTPSVDEIHLLRRFT